MSRNKSQYEKNAFKAMQYAFWQTVIEAGGLYNFASFSTKCGVMKEYDIDIQIYIEEFEVS
ncbi:MAG: hypothetical protein ACI4VQ_06340 [Clostridia bacterium]